MVRFKKRYFVVQLDREKDIYDPFSKHHQASLKPRAIQDSRPLDIPDGVLAATVKDLVQQIHGDFGRASITTGLRTIYCNSETHLVLIQCRHGPHRLVASSLPFLTKIKDEKIVPKLIYTGATIKNCYKVYVYLNFIFLKYLSSHLYEIFTFIHPTPKIRSAFKKKNIDFFSENGEISKKTAPNRIERIEKY